ncbi:Por secretion system C-terminal sorting domain-containing protein [Epilithonimonas lactis]|uniref:Secretion system C-terminal sorting domain-containing protein n=2 Tax=Epilithonimonas lactis TaxID=421072 RepID=A0A085BL42_9FLAO|nr:hypothetical protein IO89_00890 [Epilithonimonas lactis]SEQ04584.1 Por secretion system C-terminal sorting domain-containing protein [Epilithonimonas lactis]
MYKYLSFILIAISTQIFASTIEIPKESYRIDKVKRLIVCNTNLSTLKFDTESIKLKMENSEYKVLDQVTILKIGIRYTIVLNQSFERYSIYFTELPLLYVESDSQISDSPKVLSKISLIENNGTITTSNAGIEYRGATSQNYPKKSFEIEFWKDNAGSETLDISLLGMREDKDWNLQAIYNEPLKITSSTAWEVWKRISTLYYIEQESKAKSGVDSKFAEVFVNNSYQGIYAIAEKIDRKQLKLKKNNETEIRGELYKADSWETTAYYDLPPFDNTSETWGGFEYKYPKDLRDWSNLYNLHSFVINSDDETFYSQYKEKYDNKNLIDYFIFLNLMRASDNTGKNVYTARYDKNGKYFFIPWDLDGVLGRVWDSSVENVTADILTNGLYTRLLNDSRDDGFRSDLDKRWTELRSNTITVDHIMQILIDNFDYLKSNGALERDQIANSGSTISSEYEEFLYIRKWLTERIAYLDKTFLFEKTTVIPPTEEINKNDSKFQFYPNPAKNYIYFTNKNVKAENTFLDIDIYTIAGRKVRSVTQNQMDQSLYIGNIPNGNYILNIKSDAGIKQSFKLIIDK